MILTILVVIKSLFKNGTAQFVLNDCELTEDGSKVRTTFYTSGTTKWGANIVISGEDYFWFANGSRQIVRHQSSWDQTPEELFQSFRG